MGVAAAVLLLLAVQAEAFWKKECVLDNGETVGNGFFKNACQTTCLCFNGKVNCFFGKVGCLKEGDVCYRFCEAGDCTPVNRKDECPQGTTCMRQSNLIGFNSLMTCQKPPLAPGDVCYQHCSWPKSCEPVRRTQDCPEGYSCGNSKKTEEFDLQMTCAPALTGCKLSCGKEVMLGWRGNDEGANSCNTCECGEKGLVCTEQACPPTSTPCDGEPALPCSTSDCCRGPRYCECKGQEMCHTMECLPTDIPIPCQP